MVQVYSVTVNSRTLGVFSDRADAAVYVALVRMQTESVRVEVAAIELDDLTARVQAFQRPYTVFFGNAFNGQLPPPVVREVPYEAAGNPGEYEYSSRMGTLTVTAWGVDATTALGAAELVRAEFAARFD